MRTKLSSEDLLNPLHLPAIVFFNAISNSDFVEVIEQMSAGIGTGINDVDCSFPDDIEECEEKFDGVRFSLIDEEVILNYEMFYYYLNKACENYLDTFPDDRSKIDLNLTSIRERYRLH
ncbi:ribonuclease toxin immunity protein CdiI [Saccharibacillus sacchari]|uniref:ribonuclease toxin immunity protein CdiI n=1 Tax=Saccharibacillus sacchari TaxID=456493 RepID=UPI0005648623|nr:ribonuclease toxin immunity protein CdiI [Saccharibacillus sacchari]